MSEERTPRTAENDERFRGLIGAWDHPDEPLPYVMRLFADAMPVQYRGWAEVIRGWAYRLDREPDAATPQPGENR